MPAKLIKQLTKTSEQDWSGIRLCRFETSVNSTPDPRDAQPNFEQTEARIARSQILDNRKESVGYIGWDREYVDDNTVRLIWYFDTLANATLHFSGLNLFFGSNPTDPNASEEYKNILRNKKEVYNYTVDWFYVDEDGNEELIQKRT
jgi:hypothetical protein